MAGVGGVAGGGVHLESIYFYHQTLKKGIYIQYTLHISRQWKVSTKPIYLPILHLYLSDRNRIRKK